jgi:hypothetical protein
VNEVQNLSNIAPCPDKSPWELPNVTALKTPDGRTAGSSLKRIKQKAAAGFTVKAVAAFFYRHRPKGGSRLT